MDGVEMFYAPDRKAWRDWLVKNHAAKKAVWLVDYKAGSGKTRVSYNDAVDEAICFGWIDSKPNKQAATRERRISEMARLAADTIKLVERTKYGKALVGLRANGCVNSITVLLS